MKHNLLERLTCYGTTAVGALLLFGAPLSRAQEDATNPPAAANLAEEPALEAGPAAHNGANARPNPVGTPRR